jgi:hypothetical protein
MNCTFVYGGHGHIGLNKWDGHTSTFLGAPDPRPPPLTPSYIATIASFDDGSGPALYVAGVWSSFSGVPSNGLIRYDPVRGIQAVGAGSNGLITWMGEFKSPRGWALFGAVGDGGTRVNGGTLTEPGFLYVGCRAGSCEGDCDGDGILSVGDFTCFMQKYALGDPYANCDGSMGAPVFNVADFICFMQRYGRGCSR